MIVVAILTICVAAAICRLPEHDEVAALALANLSAEFVPLAIGAPDAGGIAGRMRRSPEGDDVDAAIGLA
jgi:hypothetical protein